MNKAIKKMQADNEYFFEEGRFILEHFHGYFSDIDCEGQVSVLCHSCPL